MIFFRNSDSFLKRNWGKPKFKKRISFFSIFFVSYLTQADLRHSHASLLVEMNFSIKEIADRLGHEKVETTLNTYSHLYPNKQAQLADRLNGEFQRKELEI